MENKAKVRNFNLGKYQLLCTDNSLLFNENDKPSNPINYVLKRHKIERNPDIELSNGLKVYSFKALDLVTHNIDTIGDLISLKTEDLSKIKGLGLKRKKIVLDKVHSIGLKFADEKQSNDIELELDYYKFKRYFADTGFKISDATELKNVLKQEIICITKDKKEEIKTVQELILNTQEYIYNNYDNFRYILEIIYSLGLIFLDEKVKFDQKYAKLELINKSLNRLEELKTEILDQKCKMDIVSESFNYAKTK